MRIRITSYNVCYTKLLREIPLPTIAILMSNLPVGGSADHPLGQAYPPAVRQQGQQFHAPVQTPGKGDAVLALGQPRPDAPRCRLDRHQGGHGKIVSVSKRRLYESRLDQADPYAMAIKIQPQAGGQVIDAGLAGAISYNFV